MSKLPKPKRGSRLLRDYINNNNLTIKHVAQKGGIDHGGLCRLMRQASPNVYVELALAIERATDGAVPLLSWAQPDEVAA